MSLNGFHTFQPMGYVPYPPKQYPTYYVAPPISPMDDATFDAWLALPPNDLRTLDEYAANPVLHEVTWSFLPPVPDGRSILTGTLKESFSAGPPYHFTKG